MQGWADGFLKFNLGNEVFALVVLMTLKFSAIFSFLLWKICTESPSEDVTYLFRGNFSIEL